MWHQNLHVSLFVLSLLLLFAQLPVRQKHAVHLWFALFCGSIAILALQRLKGADWGVWQYLIGLGACLTCNGYWLVARALFRPVAAVGRYHMLAAATVAVLVMGLQMLQLVQTQWQLAPSVLAPLSAATGELLTLLSSTMLMLTLWEGCRGFAQAQRAERHQRLMFVGSFAAALFLCLIVTKIWPAAATDSLLRQNLAAVSAIWMLVMTQGLILWRYPRYVRQTAAASVETKPALVALSDTDQQLLSAITSALVQEQLFLQPNLKVADLARRFALPEYRISRLLRQQYPQWNFNQLINDLRIRYASTLLADPDKQHWPVLVVGLESGFASAGPFSRAFKAVMGKTPHEYRQQRLNAQL